MLHFDIQQAANELNSLRNQKTYQLGIPALTYISNYLETH